MSRTFRKNYPEKKASKKVRKFLDLANSPIEPETKENSYDRNRPHARESDTSAKDRT